LIVHLIRHGQAYNTHREPGEPYPANPPLTPVGVRQAERLAERMKRLPIDRVVSSPMLRSIETATIVGRAIGRPVEVWARCYEYRAQPGYLCWGAREVLARYPELIVPEDFGPDDWPYGEEPLEQAIERARAFVAWLRDMAGAGHVKQLAVVAHGGFTRLVLAQVLDVELARLEPIVVDNTSLTTLRVDGAGVRVLALNDSAHLCGADVADALAGITR
jgi:probable phosphoglycerate mutase